MRRGATLVELLVAMAILAVLAGLSLPPLAALMRRNSDGLEARLSSEHARAIRTGIPGSLTDSAGRRWRFLPDGQVVRWNGIRLDGATDGHP